MPPSVGLPDMSEARTPITSAAEYVTITVNGQLFGLPIARVQDVFMLHKLTRVPLAPDDIAGVINLRGRIVTAIDLRRRLGLSSDAYEATMAVGIDQAGEAYGLVIDAVGEVLKLSADTAEPVPVNLDSCLKQIASGVHRLDAGLLVILDVDRLIDFKPVEMAA